MESAVPEQDFAHQILGSEARPDNSDGTNAGHPPAWNRRPINGDSGSVMGGAVPWPTLSESTRPVLRSSSDSSGPVSDGSAAPSQSTPLQALKNDFCSGFDTVAPLISEPPQIQATQSNASANNSSRPRSRTRGGGSSGSGSQHNTFQRPSPPAPPVFPGIDLTYRPSPSMPYTQRPGVRNSPRNTTSRRGNYGGRGRGDLGPHQNNYGGGRRHQDRRDFNVPPLYIPPMGYMPPPPLPLGISPFMTQPPVTVYPGQMGFEMASPLMFVPPLLPHEPFSAMPIVPPPPPMLFPPAYENTLTNRIVKQIDYYFSDDNLAKDNFLRSKMDDNGWVPIRIVASFNLVEDMSKDIQVVSEALRHSTFLEMKDDKIRRRVTWKKWVSS